LAIHTAPIQGVLRFTRVNVQNDTRAPLLLIAGGAGHTVPASLVRQTYQTTCFTGPGARS
jgi:hypothetical protein